MSSLKNKFVVIATIACASCAASLVKGQGNRQLLIWDDQAAELDSRNL